MPRPIITLTTDFGTRDYFAAAMKGVLLSIAPRAVLVDVTHEIDAFETQQAAFVVDQAVRCFPKGSIHVVVVDPGVGSERRPILAQADGQYFVAPDNGVLSMIFARGKKPIVRAITAERYFRKPVSATFHGRDVFAPVAAHLAKGVAAARFGPKIDNALRLTLPPVQRTGKRAWSGCVLHVDRFGNIITNFHRDDFAAAGSSPFAATIGMHAVTRLATNYGEAAFGEPVAIWGSAGYLEIVVNQGNAARMLGVGAGAPVDFGYL